MEIPSLPKIELEYSRIKALISNQYIRSFYSHEVSQSPALKEFGSDQIKALADIDIADTNDLRKIGAKVLLLITAFFASTKVTIAPWNQITSYVAPLLMFSGEFSLFWLHNNKYREHHATDRIFFTLLTLESYTWNWDLNKDRWQLAARLEDIARSVERIPLGIRKIAPSVRSECLKASRMKAQAIRDLELSVIKWQPSTFDSLTTQLVADLRLMIEGRWYDLAEADYVYQTSRFQSIIRIIGALMPLGGAIAIVSYASKLGSTAQILATVLITISVALLSVSGISTDLIAKSAQTGSSILAKK